MIKQRLQYLNDSIVIESIAAQELGLRKQAGLFQELNLGSVAESLKGFVKNHVNEQGPGGYIGGVLNLMAPSILFRAHPIVGILYLIASQFGFDLQGIFAKIVNLLRPKLESGKSITASEISDIGKSVIAQEAGEPVTAAPEDLLEPLQKYAAGASLPETPFLVGGNGGLLQRIFGQLFSLPRGKSKAVWLLGGFVIWIIKTILVGAGLVAGAEAISKAVGHQKPEAEQLAPATQEQSHESAHDVGQNNHEQEQKKNWLDSLPSLPKFNNNELWVVPILGGSVENTLWQWIEEFHPGQDEAIKQNSSFQNVLHQLNDPKKVSQKYLIMPDNFSSRQEVVNKIIQGLK